MKAGYKREIFEINVVNINKRFVFPGFSCFSSGHAPIPGGNNCDHMNMRSGGHACKSRTVYGYDQIPTAYKAERVDVECDG